MVADLRWPRGFSVRPATLADIPAAVDLFNACSLLQLGVKEHDEDGLRLEWGAPGFNAATDARLVFSKDGTLVGYGEMWNTDAPYVRAYTWGRVHPDYTGRGIGTSLLRWEEERARETIDKAPPEAKVVLLHWALHGDDAAQDLLHANGFRLVRHFWRMLIEFDRPIPEPSWPEGIRVRTFVPNVEDRPLVAAIRDAFRDHWGFVESDFEEDVTRTRHWYGNDPHFDPSLWFLAVEGEEIVGVALCRKHQAEDLDLGWVSTVGVRRPWRKRGVALALLHHAFRELGKRGKKRVGLGVDSSSLTGATRLYERAGMRVSRQHDSFEKELRPGIDLSTQSVK